jgi:DedD protein
MAKQLTDEEMHLRRKLRRRLIGAAALMLAVVVILPMVLDSEQKITGEDIELRIPAPDKVGEFVPGKATEELVDIPASAVPVSAVSLASAVYAPAPNLSPALPITQAVPAQLAPEKSPVPVAQKTPTPIPVKTPEPAQAETTKPEPVKSAPSKHDVPTSAQSHPNPAQLLTDKTASASGFVAQVGAYSNAEAAKHELAKLKGWGFKAYTEKSGDKVRVRVGPYAEHDKVEKVRHLLEKHGLHPVVIPLK